MKSRTLLLALLVTTGRSVEAAPPPPLESLLERAETVVLVRTISITPQSAKFQVTELLRGKTKKVFELGYEGGVPPSFLRVNSEVLLVSQVDAKFGKPSAILGRPLEAQGIWCGWTPLPVSRKKEKAFVEQIFSFVDGEPFSDGPSSDGASVLSLERTKSLVKRFPFDPHLHEKP